MIQINVQFGIMEIVFYQGGQLVFVGVFEVVKFFSNENFYGLSEVMKVVFVQFGLVLY